jgi:hypothetical protein
MKLALSVSVVALLVGAFVRGTNGAEDVRIGPTMKSSKIPRDAAILTLDVFIAPSLPFHI